MTHTEQAKLVLGAFEHFKARPGMVVRISQLNSFMTGNHLHASDISSGVAYCMAHKWIEAVPGNGYKLTPVGYSKI